MTAEGHNQPLVENHNDIPTTANSLPLPALQQPLVFQCKKCLSIVGDTSKLFAAVASHRIIVLEEKSDMVCIGTDPIVQPDPEAFDYMSTCLLLSCATCSQVLGRSYISGNIHVMHWIQKYILETDSLQCYELGSPVVRQGAVYDIPSALSLQKQILQLQKFCFASRDRIQQLEARVEEFKSNKPRAAPRKKAPSRKKNTGPPAPHPPLAVPRRLTIEDSQ
jgi:hypothetical protein